MRNPSSTGLVSLWIAALVIFLDRISKVWAINHLHYLVPLRLLPIFNLTLAYNKGAAFGFLHRAQGWQNLLLGSLATVVSLFLIYWLATLSRRAYWEMIALNLILGGALGNAWDRIQYGYVIDFFNFHYQRWHFAIFNVADSAICVGGAMLIIFWLKTSAK